ncbi:hypothetical protein ACSQ76_14305 [Roseovarius sp. B08]|uniref:hypothetical protein n=1 Tax=Roseovarius sp. B08 TaxID=3449223 RepID=UPI003EDBA6CE
MKAILTAAALALTATTAFADTVTVTRAIAGATLHETDADMSVYWVEDGDAYALTAFYVTGEAPADPARLRMHLADGDKVTFGLPGVKDRLFTFARDGETVSVRSARVSVDYASK